MQQTELLALLRCPDDHSNLAPADEDVVSRVNAAIREGRLRNRVDKQVERPIDGGLLRADGAYLYPIVDEIPVLLRDDAIPMHQLRDRV